MASSIDELLSLVKAQQKDLHDLRQQLNVLQSAQQQTMTAVAHEVQTVEERVCSRLDGSLAAFYKEECILKLGHNGLFLLKGEFICHWPPMQTFF